MTKTNKKRVKDIVEIAIIAALYVVLTILIQPLAYAGTQFRISELLMLLCFFNKKYSLSMIVGCLVANLWSPYLLWDMIFGTTATALACYFMTKSKHIIVASLFPAIFNGIIVGAEIAILDKLPYLLQVVSVAFGEIVVVTIIGCTLFTILMKNSEVKKLICEKKSEDENDKLVLHENEN